MKRILLFATSLLAVCCSQAPKGHSPVNREATKEAREVLEFLYSIDGKYTLTGEHNFATDLNLYDSIVFAMTGKRPVVWGADFSFDATGDDFQRFQHAGPATMTVPFKRPCVQGVMTLEEARQGIVDEAIAKWKEGRLITLMWHCIDPREGGTNSASGSKVWTYKTGAPSLEEWDELCTDGTPLNSAWKKEMDTVIPYLKQLRDAHVPVLWRPFHEMNGEWFWWGGKPGENGFARLWKVTFDYMTEAGLNNLLWVFDPNAPRVKENDDAYAYADYYPGNDYVDVLAADIYGRDFKLSHHDDLITLGGGKPIAIGELGQLPQSPEFFEQQPHWTWFMVWGYFINNFSSDDNGTHLNTVKAIYDSPRTLTLDEISFEGGVHSVKSAQ